MWVPSQRTLLLCVVVCLAAAATATRARNKFGKALAFTGHPSPRMCVQLCRRQRSVTTCKCPSKPEVRPNPCQSKICRRGSRCKVFPKNRPVCIPVPKGCFQPQLAGLCTGKFLRFSYNARSNRCQPFIFGGCSPNANNFITHTACQRRCVFRAG